MGKISTSHFPGSVALLASVVTISTNAMKGSVDWCSALYPYPISNNIVPSILEDNSELSSNDKKKGVIQFDVVEEFS